MHVPSMFLLAALSSLISAAPAPIPESVGADGTCTTPDITVSSVNKVSLGPQLVSGARVDANPGGGAAAFSKTYSVSTTVTGGAGLDLTGTDDITKIITLGIGLDPSFSISHTTGSATAATPDCPANDLNYTITWGLQSYIWNWHVVGTKTYYGYDPLMRDCNADEISHPDGGTIPYDADFPISQAGADDGSGAEVTFQCCTDSRGAAFPGSPVCPDAT